MTIWTAHEDATVRTSLGLAHKNIAKLLPRRSVNAIGKRIREVHEFRVRSYNIAPREKEEFPRVTISKGGVCEWYALGWRFADFAPGGMVVMEWRGRGEARFVG